MKKYIFIQGLICSVLFMFCCSPGFAKTTENFNMFELKAYTNSAQKDSSNIFLAKKDKTSKRQNIIKKGVGTGKGKGLEHQQEEKKTKKEKSEYSEGFDDGDKEKKVKKEKSVDSEGFDDGDKEKKKEKKKKKGNKEQLIKKNNIAWE